MELAIRRFSPEDDMMEVVDEIQNNGVAVIENLFPSQIIDSLLEKLLPELDLQEPGGGSFFGSKKRSLMSLFGRGACFSEHLLLNEKLLQVADGILLPDFPMAARNAGKAPSVFEGGWPAKAPDPRVGPNCHHYRINASVAMQVCQGGTDQPLHRDEWRYLPYMHRDPEGPEYSLAFMVAMSDFTADNGATRFIPGSNRWSQNRRPLDKEVVQAVMPKGSVAVWLGSVFHGLGTNETVEPRNGLIFSYAIDRMTQEENQFVAVPWALARTLPKKAQQLIGYRSSQGLNFIEGLEDDHVLSIQ